MPNVLYRPLVYEILFMTEKIEMEKVILDCGAGGGRPPLGLFAEWGYKCYGIDISEEAVNAARQFATKHNLEIDLRIGDFRDIPFDDETFSFVFTQNSLNHLSKNDTEIAIREMKRVLRPGGLLFVDFMSIDCSYCNEEVMGRLVGDYEFLGVHGEDESLHSFFRNDEPDRYFEDMEMVRKKKIESVNLHKNRTSTDVLLWYYLKKPSGKE
ncbi:MAG: class I SAM-dependent methyltransferase [Candidatus Thorarchaeota archaeon]